MIELRRIGVVSVMKIAFVIYLVLGFLVGLFITLPILYYRPTVEYPSGPSGIEAFVELLFGPAAVIVLPVVYGVGGALAAGLGAVIYNSLAFRLGGIQVLLLFPDQNPPHERA